MESEFYSRYYLNRAADAVRAFDVMSLGYNRCAAQLDYSGFLRRHPSKHRFSSETGRTLKSLVLVHITSGHGTFRSGPSGELPVPANSIFFAFPGVSHYYRYDAETGWNEEWMELDPKSVLPILREAGITPESPLKTFASAPAVVESFECLFDASRRNGPEAKVLVDALAHRVVAEAVVAWNKRSNADEDVQAVERMRQALLSGLSEGVSIREVARASGKCESRMRDLFKKTTGLSPKKFQMRARLVRAGRLLRETDLPVSVIAERTGFESVFAFSRRFSKLLGFSPSEYRSRKLRKTMFRPQ